MTKISHKQDNKSSDKDVKCRGNNSFNKQFSTSSSLKFGTSGASNNSNTQCDKSKFKWDGANLALTWSRWWVYRWEVSVSLLQHLSWGINRETFLIINLPFVLPQVSTVRKTGMNVKRVFVFPECLVLIPLDHTHVEFAPVGWREMVKFVNVFCMIYFNRWGKIWVQFYYYYP